MLTGSWKTTYGTVRLVQVGDLFVGDYAENGIIVAGRAEDGTISGQFTNGSRVGELSWKVTAGRIDGVYEITFEGSWRFLDGNGSGSWSGEKTEHDKPNLIALTGLPVEVMNDPVTQGALGVATDPEVVPAPGEGDSAALADAIREAAREAREAIVRDADQGAGMGVVDPAPGLAPEVISRWSAGDLVLGMQTEGGFRQYIVLEAPEPEQVGRVMLRGWAAPDGPFVNGYATEFRDGCPALDYPIAGLDLQDTEDFVFLGFKPFVGRDCAQSGYIQSVVTWTRID